LLICLATTQTRTKNSGTAGLQFQDFPGFSRLLKDLCLFQDFPGPGILNNKIPGLSRTFQDLYEPCIYIMYTLKDSVGWEGKGVVEGKRV